MSQLKHYFHYQTDKDCKVVFNPTIKTLSSNLIDLGPNPVPCNRFLAMLDQIFVTVFLKSSAVT